MKAWATPGASIGVIEDFEVAWARGFGVLRAGSRAEVSAATPFQAASLSKPVFALAVLRLVQDGLLDLDADVNDYLRSWRVPANEGWQPRITLRQLLSHSAGVNVHGFGGYAMSAPRPSLKRVLRGAKPSNSPPVVVDRLPGLQHRYSGGGSTIAQQIVIDVTRQPFPELMRELVFAPLGMTSSTYAQPLPPAIATKAATAHPWKGKPLRGRWHVYPELAAAGLWSTAADLCRLGAEFMRAVNGKTSSLGLRQDLAVAMLKPQLAGQAIGDDFAGLGWSCSGKGEAFRCGHGGWNEGFVSVISLLPATGKGAVVMLNSNEGAPLREEIIRAIADEYGWPGEFARTSPIPAPSDIDYAGIYLDDAQREFRIERKGNRLLLIFGAQPPVTLEAYSPTHFAARTLNLSLRFEEPEHKLATTMTVIQDGTTIAARRLG
jgi:CubicO group peptidase (beta-lactamase class C family)